MGLSDFIKSVNDLRLAEAAETIYEPRLIDRGLGKNQIQHQSLPELEQSLERVDEAISQKETFEAVRLKLTADGGVVISSTDDGFQTNIGPTLLSRKALILKRIRQLKAIEEVGTLRNLVASTEQVGTLRTLIETNVSDPERTKILEKIDSAEKDAIEFRRKERQVEGATRQERLKEEAEIRRIEAEGTLFVKRTEAEGKRFRERAEVLQSFLARESIASVVGSVLLLVFAIVLVVAMFKGTQVTEIVSNAFLVLLGYFFGQTVARKAGGGSSV